MLFFDYFYHVVFEKKKICDFLKRFRCEYFTYLAKNFFNWLLILIKLCFFKCTDYLCIFCFSKNWNLFIFMNKTSFSRFWHSLFWSNYSHVFSATIVVDNRTTHIPGNVTALTILNKLSHLKKYYSRSREHN